MALSPPPLRVALVGYGMAGADFHTPLLREAGLRVTHVATGNHERAARAAQDHPEAQVVPDLDAVLAEAGDLDLVVLASPPAVHVEQAHRVIDAGVALVVDKPLAPDADQARGVVTHAEHVGVPVTVFHNRRWDDEQRTLEAVLDTGLLGTVHRFERRWERWRPVPKDRWKENDPVAGGLLLDLGPHLVDAAVRVLGPVRSVFAQVRSLSTAADDDVFLALTHTAGQVSHLWAGSLVAAPGPRTRVLGDRAAFLVTEYEADVSPFQRLDAGVAPHGGWIARGGRFEPVPVPPGGPADFYREVAAWLRDTAPPPVDPWDAVRTAEVLDAARRSAREGSAVALPG